MGETPKTALHRFSLSFYKNYGFQSRRGLVASRRATMARQVTLGLFYTSSYARFASPTSLDNEIE
ncbi:MAG: hypothetical protein HC764_24720 [Pleurocapsa sp. CRU_1_2]|nr:hypothetical protein [Pleurocapsa sp. CRU_1_2]